MSRVLGAMMKCMLRFQREIEERLDVAPWCYGHGFILILTRLKSVNFQLDCEGVLDTVCR